MYRAAVEKHIKDRPMDMGRGEDETCGESNRETYITTWKMES